jgi:hypothetical protein
MAIKEKKTINRETGFSAVDIWEHMTITRTLDANLLSDVDDDKVCITMSKRKEFDDGSTDFDNFCEFLFVTPEQALAFAHAIIKQVTK